MGRLTETRRQFLHPNLPVLLQSLPSPSTFELEQAKASADMVEKVCAELLWMKAFRA